MAWRGRSTASESPTAYSPTSTDSALAPSKYSYSSIFRLQKKKKKVQNESSFIALTESVYFFFRQDYR